MRLVYLKLFCLNNSVKVSYVYAEFTINAGEDISIDMRFGIRRRKIRKKIYSMAHIACSCKQYGPYYIKKGKKGDRYGKYHCCLRTN